MIGSWLFLLLNSSTCFLLLVMLAEMKGKKEGMRNKETCEAIKTQFNYYGISILSLEGGRPPWAI